MGAASNIILEAVENRYNKTNKTIKFADLKRGAAVAAMNAAIYLPFLYLFAL